MTDVSRLGGGALRVGDEVELDVGQVAHGGFCVARHDGQVVFVRYALPDERVVVRITEVAKRFARGEAVRVLRADPQRVAPPCAHFGPGGCGGCDFQHARPELQRELKARVVSEQLRRLAGIERSVVVEPLPGGSFGWRRHVRWAVAPGDGEAASAFAPESGAASPSSAGDASGSGIRPVIGPRRYRSHDVVPVSVSEPCLIADPAVSAGAVSARPPTTGAGGVRATEVVVSEPSDGNVGDPVAVTWVRRGRSAGRGNRTLLRVVGDRRFEVASDGFWQAHRHAAEVLSEAVRSMLPTGGLVGGRAWDLYGGVGLFAAELAEAVGPDGQVVTVESDRRASQLAARNLADLPQVAPLCAPVERALADPRSLLHDSPNVVVLDPPRSGAGAAVCREIAQRRPGTVIYVACDPAALARDAATFGECGYELASLRAFDAFPATHHVECVAQFVPTPQN